MGDGSLSSDSDSLIIVRDDQSSKHGQRQVE